MCLCLLLAGRMKGSSVEPSWVCVCLAQTSSYEQLHLSCGTRMLVLGLFAGGGCWGWIRVSAAVSCN